MGELRLEPHVAHDVTVDGRRVLFHIPTSGLFELDRAGAAVLDVFKAGGDIGANDLERHFDGRFPAAAVAEAVKDFLDLGILHPPTHVRGREKPIEIKEFPLSTMVVNVTTGCNLGCAYCYKEDLAPPTAAKRMDFATAAKSVDLLLTECGDRERVNIVFFGGEPLSNLPLIREVVDYAQMRCAEAGKRVDFSLTTNATLLNEAVIDYLDAHGFSISVSIDGPKAIHDRHRKTVGGKGTHDLVSAKARLLLARYTARPVAARVTITAGAIDVAAIHHHLFHDLGFHEVGFAPVTAGEDSPMKLGGAELGRFFEAMTELGRTYREAALDGRNIGFSNLHQLMSDLYLGNRKTLPCGAGVGLLAVEPGGKLALCHRFTGADFGNFGSVDKGIMKPELGQFIADAASREGTVCETCRIRNLCAGGCYHESYLNYHDPLSPTYLYCDLMRAWIDFGIETYVAIRAGNPDFFTTYIAPRGPSRVAMDLG